MNVLIVFLVFCVAFISAEDHLRERRFLFDVSCQRMFKQSNNAYCTLRFVGHFVTVLFGMSRRWDKLQPCITGLRCFNDVTLVYWCGVFFTYFSTLEVTIST